MHPIVYVMAYWLVACGVAYVAFTRKSMDSVEAVMLGLLWGPALFIATVFLPVWIPVVTLDWLTSIRARRARQLREVDQWLDDTP